MIFPEIQERVIYKNNPIIEVICQFRYPDILRITASDPVDFQDEIRQVFPHFKQGISEGLNIPQNIAKMLPQTMFDMIGEEPTKSYQFISADEKHTLGLTRNFVALTTNEYTRWEDFREKIELSVSSFDKIYSPAFVSRIGLRYQNLVCLSKLGLDETTRWSELVNPILAGFLGLDSVFKSVEDTSHTVMLTFENLGKVKLRYGLATVNATSERCFLIDSDFFVEGQMEVQDGITIINEFNRRNRNLFRWCITDQLHQAMEPSRA